MYIPESLRCQWNLPFNITQFFKKISYLFVVVANPSTSINLLVCFLVLRTESFSHLLYLIRLTKPFLCSDIRHLKNIIWNIPLTFGISNVSVVLRMSMPFIVKPCTIFANFLCEFAVHYISLFWFNFSLNSSSGWPTGILLQLFAQLRFPRTKNLHL